jgi:hypothetical protein
MPGKLIPEEAVGFGFINLTTAIVYALLETGPLAEGPTR